MKRFLGCLGACVGHRQARCDSKMAHKNNNSTQMKACLNFEEMDGDSRAGSSKDTTDGSFSKQKHSNSCSYQPSESRQNPGAEAHSGDRQGEVKLRKEPECHMDLDKLFPSRNHTVLIDTKKFSEGRIVPHKGTHVWDNVHVKLPNCQQPQNSREPRWAVIIKALRGLMRGSASVGDVEGAITTYNSSYKRDWCFNSLYKYVAQLHSVENNFNKVISRMAELALKLPDLIQHPIPLLKQKMNHTITMSQEQISCLLANAFFCTFPHRNTKDPKSEYSNYPYINFSSLFGDYSLRKLQKLRAIFNYFNTVTDEATKPNGLVTFQRISLDPRNAPNWNTQTEDLTNLRVYSKGLIEIDGKGMLQVDFAAKAVGGGVLGRGLVQEEILFLQCPELIVARLFTEKLADNECLKITGVQMYNRTIGYSDKFEWNGPNTDDSKRDEWKRHFRQIVAIDALNFDDPRQQFTEKNIRRELFKAYVGFKGDLDLPKEYTPAIATGNWGCGAFKGDPMLKALIQIMAASVAQRDLAYFTFDNKKQAADLENMYALLKRHKVTVGKLYKLLQDYCKHYSHNGHKAKNVFDYIRDKIAVPSSLL